MNLAKRKDTLIKLFEQTKAYLKFENDTYTKVAELRSGKTTKNNINESNKEQILMNSIARDINIAYEQYPNLKANSIIVDLISASQYIENEIAASRRLYNMDVTQFNQSIMLYPAVVKAEKMKLYTLPLFVASEEQKKGVDMSGLSDFNK
ncbi:LemA family [Chlamydia trachomatis]|nr:LemA family [Chlamydia trachomatis]SYV92076.1 LemA family [Mesomycoplasma hyorhinis]